MKKPTALIILDGFGYSEEVEGNAITKANMPFYDSVYAKYPHTLLQASGKSVGLPEGTIGSSEVGHTNIGAGRIVIPDLNVIDAAITEGTFQTNAAFVGVMEYCKKNGKALHIMGLMSDAGVHSHMNHAFELLGMAKVHGLSEVYLHCIMDGRDTAKDAGINYIHMLNEKTEQIGIGKIASIGGRMYAMDRDNNIEMMETAYNALVLGEAEHIDSAAEYVEQSYAKGIYDEQLVPAVINGMPQIQDGDGLIFFNYRGDRAIQILMALTFNEAELATSRIKGLERKKVLSSLYVASMFPYDSSIAPKLYNAFPKTEVPNYLSEYFAKLGYKQLKIAETEKYKHITAFFNCGDDKSLKREKWVLIDSPKHGITSYAERPHMAAEQIADRCIAELETGEYDVITLNFANPDIVGHSGDFAAVVEALEFMDKQLQKVVEKVLGMGGKLCITADHGNCDEMIDPKTGDIAKKHSLNPVPFILVDPSNNNVTLRKSGLLCDIAPTFLQMMGLAIPKEMTGVSLIEN